MTMCPHERDFGAPCPYPTCHASTGSLAMRMFVPSLSGGVRKYALRVGAILANGERVGGSDADGLILRWEREP